MRMSELQNKLAPIKIAKTNEVIVYSKIAEDKNSYTFLSFSTGFDILEYLTNKGCSTASTGKVLKNTLSDNEKQMIKETGFALGLNGVFCTVSIKALLELCVLLGLRGTAMSHPNTNRDLLIASLLGRQLHFVYYQGEHPEIIGISGTEYIPNNWFEMVNAQLLLIFGEAVSSQINCTEHISINYRYQSSNKITPIVTVRDRISGTQKYEIAFGYEISNVYIPTYCISGTDTNAVWNEAMRELPEQMKRTSVLDKYIIPEYSSIKEYSEFLYSEISKMEIITLPEFVEFAKKHNIPAETVSKVIINTI